MDRSSCKEIVEKHIERLIAVLGIAHWKIKVSYDPDHDGNEAGRCTRLYDYNQAWITFNPELLDTESDVLGILIHELCHIVISPFDLFAGTVEETLGEDHKAYPALQRVWRNAMEKTVINLVRMYGELTDPDSLAESKHDEVATGPVVEGKKEPSRRKPRR